MPLYGQRGSGLAWLAFGGAGRTVPGMCWKPTLSGALLLAVACGDAEGQGNDSVQGEERPSPEVSAPAAQPTGAGGASPEGAPEVNDEVNPTVIPAPPSPAQSENDVEPDEAQVEPASPAVEPGPPAVEPGPPAVEPGPPPVEPTPTLDTTEGDPDPEPDSVGQAQETDVEPSMDAGAPAPLSFAADIWPLWSRERDPVFVYRGMGSYSGCADETAPCHGAPNPGALLSMADVDTAYAQMMDTPSTSGICEGTQRVAVGDPDQSCLVLFYVGRLGPDDLDWVDEAEIELMREWIRQGALP